MEDADGARERMRLAMERYSGGDDAAFGELYDLLSPRLYAFLMKQTRDAPRAEDTLQQTFLQMHRARGRFVAGSEVLPWAFAIARRLVIDGHRKGRREVLGLDDDKGGTESSPLDRTASSDVPQDELASASELSRRLGEALTKLPEAQRVAFELMKEEGLSVAEAASVLGTTVTAVKLRAHRAYEALRQALGEAYGPSGGPRAKGDPR